MSDDLWRWSASELCTAIRAKAISSREVVQAHLDRIASVNGTVNAVTIVFGADALAAADAADAATVSGQQTGPLHGLPITVKENIDVRGSATTHGIVSLKHSIAEHDAPVIAHLKDAGAIIVGRTNTPDFGLRWHTDNDLHGATLNPWNPLRTPGGSSGGEAAALATGMSPLGIGNDMGGSTRQPAVNCGVAGLRPSTGKVSRISSWMSAAPPMFYEQVACVNGPMARHIGDLRLALKVMCQPDPVDPVWTPAIAPPEPDTANLRVGLVSDPSGDGLAPAVKRALAAAAAALGRAGYQVEEIAPPMIEEADDTIQRLADIEIASYFTQILPMISSDAATILRSIIADNVADASSYRDAIAQRHRIAAAWSDLMSAYPIVLGPVSTMEPFEVGYDTGGSGAMRRLIRSLRLTELCNLLGLPSVALPVLVENGVPLGVQIIGRKFDEDRCFSAAEVIEQACPVSTPIDPTVMI